MKRDILLLILAVAAIFGLRLYYIYTQHNAQDANSAATFIWPELMQTKIHTDYVHATYSADIPDSVKAMVGKEASIAGYMVPLDVTGKSSHFILARRTPTCPFCPPGAPNEVIEVEMASPLAWTEDRIIISGTFGLINNTQAGLFFKLTNAQKR